MQLLKEKGREQKILKSVDTKWKNDKNGTLMVVYQTEEENEGEKYYPRSFEDAFLFCNRKFIIENIEKFSSLKKKEEIKEKDEKTSAYVFGAYYLATNCIKSKPAFAMDILLCSKADETTDFSNWDIPPYILEGLIWLREN